MKSFKKDLERGVASEALCLKHLQNLTKHPLRRLHERHPFDYESEDCLIELKTRFDLCSTSYRTTMLNTHKILRAAKQTKKVFFAFRFLDGIYIIEYKPELFNSFFSTAMKIDDRIDYIEVEESKTFIPVDQLTCLLRTTYKPSTML